MDTAKAKILSLLEKYPKPGTSLEQIEGEWELVLTTVPHGIFRSSPFFLAVQEAFSYAEEKGTRILVLMRQSNLVAPWAN
jgi:hypothetical protein